jgi:hypothetical protein
MYEKQLLALPHVSVFLPTWNNSAQTRWTFFKFDICLFFENLLGKFKFHENLIRLMGILHENLHTFMVVSHLIFLRMRNVSSKICREKKKHTFYVH